MKTNDNGIIVGCGNAHIDKVDYGLLDILVKRYLGRDTFIKMYINKPRLKVSKAIYKDLENLAKLKGYTLRFISCNRGYQNLRYEIPNDYNNNRYIVGFYVATTDKPLSMQYVKLMHLKKALYMI